MHELEQSLIEAEKLLQNLYSRVNMYQYDTIRPENPLNKRVYRNKLCRKLGYRLGKYSGDEWADRQRSELKRLQLSLDKLNLANNSSRSRCFKLASSVKEVNHNSLHFGMLHGMKNLSEEKKIAQKFKKLENNSSAQFPENYKNNTTYTEYPMEIMKLKQQMEEEEIQSCAVKGNKWRSLGTKEDILKNIKSLSEQHGNEDNALLIKRNLAAVERELRSLDEQWRDFWQLFTDASKCIRELRNLNQNQNIKAKETHLLNKTSSFINTMKEKPVLLYNIIKKFERLQQDA